MPQAAPVVFPLHRAFPSPNSHSFESQSGKLAHLSLALEGVGLRLAAISEQDGCPLPSWLAFELSGIGATLDCLGAMAGYASGDAENWQRWAEYDKVKDALNRL